MGKILNSNKSEPPFKGMSLEDKDRQEEEIVSDPHTDPKEQTPAEKARVLFVEDRFKELEENRNKGYQWFGLTQSPTGGTNKYLNLIQYIDESEKRLNGNIEKPDYKDDWQSNLFDNITREKTISIVARLAAQRMRAKFFNDEGLDPTFANIISNLYEKAGRGKLGQGRDDEFTVLSMWEAISKGTVVREESYRYGKRKIKDGKPDQATGKVKTKTIYEWEDVWSEIIPLEEFYPGDIRQMNIQKMPDCARGTEMSYTTFRQSYSDYPEAEKVRPGKIAVTQNRTRYRVEDDVEGKMVLVIRYYNRITDSFDIVANGRLLTSLGNPLPYEHKQLPFNVGRFELLSNTFFYGMSLAFKLAAMQDMTNSIWNLSLDQLILALKTPIFNATGSDIDIDWLYPGAIVDLKRGTDINASIREFKKDLGAFSASQSAISVIQGRISSLAGAGSEASGVAGAGRGRTAEEVATAREAALDIVGLFLRFMEWAEEDRAEQRAQIMLEKYAEPLKETGKLRKIIVDAVPLINGQFGKMYINLTDKPRQKTELDQANLATTDMSQIIDVKPKALRNFKYLIKIVPDSSVKDTEFRRRQESLKFFGIASQAPQIFNINDAALEVATAHGKDPNKALMQQKPQQGPTPEEEVAEILKGGQGGMAQGGGVRVATDKEVMNSQPDSFIQGQG